jgi:hypothetical protein
VGGMHNTPAVCLSASAHVMVDLCGDRQARLGTHMWMPGWSRATSMLAVHGRVVGGLGCVRGQQARWWYMAWQVYLCFNSAPAQGLSEPHC